MDHAFQTHLFPDLNQGVCTQLAAFAQAIWFDLPERRVTSRQSKAVARGDEQTLPEELAQQNAVLEIERDVLRNRMGFKK